MARREDNRGAVLLSTDENGARWYGNGFWRHPWYVRDVPCQDGKRRTVRLTQQADTYFSWSGRASIGGRTVRGAILTGDNGAEFHAYPR